MIKSIVMHDIPLNHIAAMERWYYKEHSAEIVGRYGPWLTRHDSYVPVVVPDEAKEFGFFNWRVTEGWWREIPLPGPRGTFAFTVPPVWPKVATCFIPAQPTEDFMGSEIEPHEKNILRWYILMRYPENVSEEEAEEWFLNVHVPEVMKQPGLYRFFSYSTVKEKIHLPGTWAPGKTPPKDTILAPWNRVVELWYETFDDWKISVIDEPPDYTCPEWSDYKVYPFLKPGEQFVCSFLLERPTDEFWKDIRGYV